MKLTDLFENFDPDAIYVVTKTLRNPSDTGPFRHGPDFVKGDKLKVTGVDSEGNASLTLPNGERIGITIPMQYLSQT